MTNRYDGFADFDDMVAQFADTNYWRDEGAASRIEAEASIRKTVADEDVLAAIYSIDGYEGSAFILFQRDGVLYEVNGGHCSCNGLEGQWEPEVTSWPALRLRKRDVYQGIPAELDLDALEGQANARLGDGTGVR